MITKRENNLFFGQLLFLALLITTGIIIFTQLKSLIGSFLGAITMYLALRNVAFYLIEKKHWKGWVASLVLVSVSVIVLVGFGYWIFKAIASEVQTVDTGQIVDGIKHFADNINNATGYKIISDNLITESKGFVMNIASSVLNTTYSVAANLFMMIILLYFMFAKGRAMERIIMEYFPFRGKSLRLMKLEIKNMIKGNAIGIPLIMLIQGGVAALGYWIFGIKGVAFWGFMTALFGLVPIVGTMGIYVPLAIFKVANGELWMGILLLLYGILLISNTDNVIRLIILKKMADTHPLITIFGVILGIPLFGFWGIIFGPLLISSFLLLIKIYYTEYGIKKGVRKNNVRRYTRTST